jgi:hypothetical protein
MATNTCVCKAGSRINENGSCGMDSFVAIISPIAYLENGDSRLTLDLEFSNPLDDNVTIEMIR